ncbi:MAG: hypothetical protein ACPGJE_01210 [Wenzhouxiangellaceae bacterium]
MIDTANHIRLVAGIEIRPPAVDARYVLERADAERLGGWLADDLAACVAAVTDGHLVIGPALLEPGQLLAPEHRAPWRALAEALRTGRPAEPGVTTLGAHRGRLSNARLGPDPTPPRGLFLCLPMLLAPPRERRDDLISTLEQKLFDSGGLRPPALGTLAETTGLKPVHGQLLTFTDLMALTKMQLAGAGLDPFWPPIEHALLEPERAETLDLPAGVSADWRPDDLAFEIAFDADADGRPAAEDPAHWLRAFRQQTALFDQHRFDWRVRPASDRIRVAPDQQWLEVEAGPADEVSGVMRIEHPDIGLMAFRRIEASGVRLYYPMRAGAIEALANLLEAD